MEAQGREFFFEQHLPHIETAVRRVAARHRLDTHERQDLYGRTVVRLLENDGAALRAFQGRSRLSTYLAAVVQRIHLDQKNRELGRWRPNARIRRLGPTAIALDRCINRDDMSTEDAVESLAREQKAPAQELRQLALQIPRRTKRRFVSAESSLDLLGTSFPKGERRLLAGEVGKALESAVRDLSEHERRLLSLRFGQSRSVKSIAEHLGLDPKPLYRCYERLFRHLRKHLEASGFSRRDIPWAAEAGFDELF